MVIFRPKTGRAEDSNLRPLGPEIAKIFRISDLQFLTAAFQPTNPQLILDLSFSPHSMGAPLWVPPKVMRPLGVWFAPLWSHIRPDDN